MIVITGLVGITLGFIAGGVAFKRTNQWCPSCGRRLDGGHCPDALGKS